MAIKKVILLATIVILGFTLIPGTVLAWDDCPRGEVNDPYPGKCARYIDTDNDGICDHSQPAPEDRETNVQNVKTTTDSLGEKSNKNNLEEVESSEAAVPLSQNQNSQPIRKLLPVIGMILFFLTGILLYVAYKKNKIK